eukprot:TRINITY_DN1961_c0_g1_i1.p1 TRINITY_DN1961_c0_g1~~TRINITY_DN1961_c0_g1_i1.p1  ORF type:complete len:149 (+),score=25.27 TRINITY_DN1961_c0_g1_i1:150-596(+)
MEKTTDTQVDMNNPVWSRVWQVIRDSVASSSTFLYEKLWEYTKYLLDNKQLTKEERYRLLKEKLNSKNPEDDEFIKSFSDSIYALQEKGEKTDDVNDDQLEHLKKSARHLGNTFANLSSLTEDKPFAPALTIDELDREKQLELISKFT